ncbi:hypothetical protein RIR_jg19774.t1 [Rhizophagus irregularis DAOM 181602=DAOM 197198]|nr:hypothetical protein RIR_jg19774.t1 [Rhizophagus irregularis DAOM 181602=DAOM 197198]
MKRYISQGLSNTYSVTSYSGKFNNFSNICVFLCVKLKREGRLCSFYLICFRSFRPMAFLIKLYQETYNDEINEE